eukprot:jgi/Tetstr1/440797/TSEL_029104.t1
MLLLGIVLHCCGIFNHDHEPTLDLGAVISFFRMVGIFIISIPQNIICIFKFAIIGTLKLIVLLPPTLWLLTLYIQMIVYSGIMRRAFMKFMFYTVLGGILFVLD